LLGVVGPGAIAAAVAAEKDAGQRRDQVLDALKRDLEAARFTADRAFRQYDATDPANRDGENDGPDTVVTDDVLAFGLERYFLGTQRRLVRVMA